MGGRLHGPRRYGASLPLTKPFSESNEGKELANLCMFLTGEVFDTLSAAMHWVTYYVATRPDVQAELYAEVRAAVDTHQLCITLLFQAQRELAGYMPRLDDLVMLPYAR